MALAVYRDTSDCATTTAATAGPLVIEFVVWEAPPMPTPADIEEAALEKDEPPLDYPWERRDEFAARRALRLLAQRKAARPFRRARPRGRHRIRDQPCRLAGNGRPGAQVSFSR